MAEDTTTSPLTLARPTTGLNNPGLENTVARVMSPTPNVVVCAGCGKYGEQRWLHLEDFMGYQFCNECLPQATEAYASFRDAERRAHITRLKQWDAQRCARITKE